MFTTDIDNNDSIPSSDYPLLFTPFKIGPLTLKNRCIATAHSAVIGHVWGTSEEAERLTHYWENRASSGIAAAIIPARLGNILIPGFEPSGISAEIQGAFRNPLFVPRMRELVSRLRTKGVAVLCQMTMIGNFPHAPSAHPSAPHENTLPHVLNLDEIQAFIDEYRFSAAQVLSADLNGVEIHANHDDVIEWFLSPLTNQRSDRYGGSLENRARYLVEILQAVRDVIGPNKVLGVRINAREEEPGGYDSDGGVEIAKYLESTGLVDYLHTVVGSPWSSPSYIQPHFYAPGSWEDLSGKIKRATSLPIIHTGLIDSPEVAERILSNGNSDVIGLARSLIADPQWVSNAQQGNAVLTRPCIRCNDCVARKHVERLPFGCAVNPLTGTLHEANWPISSAKRKILVIGGGAAGMEFAALAKESGHEVILHESSDALGGQLRVAAKAPGYQIFGDYTEWQARRLERVGVETHLNSQLSADDCLALNPDTIVTATGASSRRPLIEGLDADYVYDIRAVLNGEMPGGKHVLIIAQDDHLAPLALAAYLGEKGYRVTISYGADRPASLVSRYTFGTVMSQLDKLQVTIRVMEVAEKIENGQVQMRHAYSHQRSSFSGWDSIVLACGTASETDLYLALKDRHPHVHLLGDAYAPRRIVSATRQAYALAKTLL